MQWSPYNYVLRNPYVLIDPDGRQLYVIGGTKEEREDFIITLGEVLGNSNLLSFDSENTNRVKFNFDYQTDDKENKSIVQLIKGELKNSNGFTIKFNAEIRNLPYFFDKEGNFCIFPGEGFIDNITDELNKSITHTQYYYMPVINRMNPIVYTKEKLIQHSLSEGIYGAINLIGRDESHKNNPINVGILFSGNAIEGYRESNKAIIRIKYAEKYKGTWGNDNGYKYLYEENIK